MTLGSVVGALGPACGEGGAGSGCGGGGGGCGGVGERMEELVCRQCQEGVMRGHQDPAGVEGARIRCVN